MLNTIKKLLNNKSTNTLAEYYQSRLESSHSIVEFEAIITMNTLLSLNEEKQQIKVLK